MGGLMLLSRILGQVRDTVISYQFGQDRVTDAFRAAFSVPDLLFFLIAGGALSSAFIPIFTKYLTNGEEDEAWKVFSVLATVMGLVVLGFIVFAEFFAEPLMNLVAPGLQPDAMALASTMSRIILPSQLGFFLGGLMFGTMNARRHFTVPGLSPNIYNIGMIFGALFIAPLLAVPVLGLAWGALVGALVGNLAIPLLFMSRFGVKFKPSLDVRHPGVVSVFKLMLPVVLGLSLPGVYAIALRWFASMEGEGVISALENGNRIMQAPLGIFGQALAIAVFPTLSALYAQNKAPEFLSTLSKTLRTALFIGVFVSAMLFVLSDDVVRVLYQYGRFSAANGELVSGGLRMFSLGIFAWCAHPILMRAFFSMHNSLLPILLGTITSVIFLFLCWALSGTSLGYRGLPLATSLSAVVLMALLLIGLRSKLGRIDGARLLRLMSIAGVASVGTAGAVYFAVQLFPASLGSSHAVSLLRLLLLGLGGAWVYLGIGKLLGLEEAKYALLAISRRRNPEVAPEERQ
jgi:putative peptidoglycan lipid II flippase